MEGSECDVIAGAARLFDPSRASGSLLPRFLRIEVNSPRTELCVRRLAAKIGYNVSTQGYRREWSAVENRMFNPAAALDRTAFLSPPLEPQ